MKSMTGFGTQAIAIKSFEFEITIKSVNGRFLECRFHIPRDLISLESSLRQLVEKNWVRGTIDIFINQKNIGLQKDLEISVNQNLAKSYVKAFAQLSKIKGVKKETVGLSTLARLPDIISTQINRDLGEKEKKELVETFKSAIQLCDKERVREGQHIKSDLELNVKKLSELVKKIKDYREEVNSKLAQKFEEKIKLRMAQLSDPFELDSQRLMQEIVMQLEKSDINEELTRLDEHLRSYLEVTKASGPIGKKLDFYTQELLREVNTIGSKSNLSQLTQVVVDAKTVIERLREQVQNIE